MAYIVQQTAMYSNNNSEYYFVCNLNRISVYGKPMFSLFAKLIFVWIFLYIGADGFHAKEIFIKIGTEST